MNVIEQDVKNIEQMENNNYACGQSQKGGFDSCDDIVTIKNYTFSSLMPSSISLISSWVSNSTFRFTETRP